MTSIAEAPTESDSDLVIYKTACQASVHLAPRSIAQTTLPADAIIHARASAIVGWVRWEREKRVCGYLHIGDLDPVGAP